MTTDALIIGSGIAGLTLAIKLSEAGKRVVLCTKTSISEANSYMAQGGIAAVLSGEDSFNQHVQDTLVAGAGLCNEEVVREVVAQGPERIRELIEWGVEFDMDENSDENSTVALTREGGHSRRRIVHVADQTGRAIHRHLSSLAKKQKNIRILEHHFTLDLITNHRINPQTPASAACLGAYVMNKQNGHIFPVSAAATFLACGGAGKVYLYTSNWGGATGDGVAIAARAGARVANLEFTQFHPTCLYHPHARNFLISEALRGEGALLVDEHRRPFMEKYHPLASLAPRDIVARSIDEEMKKRGLECVYLDLTFKSKEEIQKRFPHIYEKCSELGLSIEKDLIPVVPAAHYMCGGILTSLEGKTDIRNLYAIGENACTGLHGANRLASNSLLECLVMASEAAKSFLKEAPQACEVNFPEWSQKDKEDADELIVVSHTWDEIRRLMWNYMGIVRTTRQLERALHRLELISQEIKEYYSSFRTHPDIEELRNICLVAELSVRCALMRKESRGIHFSLDYPETASEIRNSILKSEEQT